MVYSPAAQWDILKQDLRYTLRTLNRARGFALTAILVTALGVGANTAAFSVADFVLLRSLPFPNPDSLVRLCEGPRTGGGWGCMNQLSPLNYRDLKAAGASFEDMGAFADDARASSLVGQLAGRKFTAFKGATTMRNGTPLHLVLVGPFTTRPAAAAALDQIEAIPGVGQPILQLAPPAPALR